MRLFYSNNIVGNTAILGEEESKHCAQVLRLDLGTLVHLTDGRGKLWQAKIAAISKKETSLELLELVIEEEINPASCRLVIAPTKNADRMEWLIEKATEIGLASFQPIYTERTERSRMRLDRLEKIALAAMKQSNRLWLPEISEPKDLKTWLSENDGLDILIAHCEKEKPRQHLLNVAKELKAAHILIGPEGDFTQNEIDAVLEMGGKAVDLGNARLRVETAALYACVVFNLP